MSDQCRPVNVTDVNGDEITVGVHGAEPMDEESRAMFEQIVQAAQRKYLTEHPDTVWAEADRG